MIFGKGATEKMDELEFGKDVHEHQHLLLLKNSRKNFCRM